MRVWPRDLASYLIMPLTFPIWLIGRVFRPELTDTYFLDQVTPKGAGEMTKPYFLNFRTHSEFPRWKQFIWRWLGQRMTGDAEGVQIVAYRFRNITYIDSPRDNGGFEDGAL